jgi:hypothetical protein
MIGQFDEDFGPLRTWVDHGAADQDIYLFGDDPNSSYYIANYLAENNITIWVNSEDQSHSAAQDLNLDTVMYQNSSFPGLDLLRVSKYGFLEDTFGWDLRSAQVTQDQLADRQRIYALNSEVLIWHDYTWRYMYVQDGGVNYARESEASMGYPYVVYSEQENEVAGANIHPNGTWYLKPVVEEYFAAMKQDYKVWYTTPNEVYYRSNIVDDLVVSENATSVTITNPTGSNLSGLQLFTKEMPSYCLTNGSVYYLAHKGAENYQFIIPEIPAGGSIVLSKAKIPSSTPKASIGSVSATTLEYLDVLYLRTESR